MIFDISLRKKVLLSFLSLIIVSSVLTISAVLLATNNSVAEQARDKLVVGRKVFEELLEIRALQLFESAEVLTSDFGFKAAVLDNDQSTLMSVLDNHGARIGADLMMIASLEGRLIASTSEAGQRLEFPFKHLLEEAEEEGGLAKIVVFDGLPYQILMLPVLAPVASAWSVVGFQIDEKLARQLKRLTTLEVSFSGWDSAERKFELTTLEDNIGVAMRVVETQGEWLSLKHNAEEFLALVTPLVESGDYQVNAVLSSSLSMAIEQFSPLKIQILIIASIALILSAYIAFIIARNITRPVNTLVSAAERISSGDYEGDIGLDGYQKNEIGKLATSLSHMQRGIAEREDKILYQVYHDALTGLSNRASIQEKIASLVGDSNTDCFALMQVNVRHFKQVNTTFGYHVGDQLLNSISRRIEGVIDSNESAARLGSDEFLLLLLGGSESQVEARATALQSSLEEPYLINDLSIPVMFTVGVVLYPSHGDRTDLLMRRADTALNEASALKLPLLMYQPGSDEKHLKQTRLVNDLKDAINDGSLTMFYQPKLEIKKRKVTQVEALIRWIHPELGFISPEEFIGLAEQSGLMPNLSRWVIKTVLEEAASWCEQGVDLKMAVNLSAYDLACDDLPEFVAQTLVQNSLSSSSLILEVTESAMIDNPDQALKVLNLLREQGIVLAIDDYGTGYSSLSQLKDLPVDELKIDMAFILKLAESKYDQAIVKSTIDMAHQLGLTVVAEGVEDRASWTLLEQWGCDKLQGYYISRPQNSADFVAWFNNYDVQSEY
jgi:diguanylate cyclase (GGDEF)-like protein